MDSAVAVVQSYLHINGYFTVTEYPVVEAMRHGGYRTVTDVDVLAVRFPHAGRLVPRPGKRTRSEPEIYETDPELGAQDDVVDMLIGEVKQGRAELNRGARDPAVLRAILTRFGSCPVSHADRMIDGLLHHGSIVTPSRHRVRLVAFGGSREGAVGHGVKVMTLRHVVTFIRTYLHDHWDVLHHGQFTDPGLDLLMLLEKLGLGAPRIKS